jgi:radical SAM superfamily enzyme YgiQ (UPF0313 family)
VVIAFSADRLKNLVAWVKPDIVGATAVTINEKKALRIFDDCKRIDPSIVTVMGGPHATFDAENLMAGNPSLDFIVRREGEATFEEFCRCLGTGSGFSHVKGLSFRNDAGIVHNEDRPLIEDINTLPIPDRSLVELSKYKAMRLAINMVTSRGCPHQCIFCVGSKMVGRKVRYFDVARVVDEFEMLVNLGFRQVNIVDDLFTSHKKRCMQICDEIVRRGITHPWSAFARVDTVNEELLDSLKRAGCTDLCFGIESGNQEILDLVKKKTNLEVSRKAIEMCRKAGIRPLASFILGLPGETRDTMKKTMEFAASLGAHYGYHILAPFPGSEVREERDRYRMRIVTDDWDRYDANQCVCEQDGVACQEIDRAYGDFNEKFKARFSQMLTDYGRGEHYPPEVETMIRNFKEFHFAMTVVVEDLIAQFTGLDNGRDDNAEERVSAFLAEKTGYAIDDARTYVRAFLDSGCIAAVRTEGKEAFRWT